MPMTASMHRWRGVFGWLAGGLLLSLPLGTLAPTAAAPLDPTVTRDAGSWDMIFERGNRRCRLVLRPDTNETGYAAALPAGCHRAFPMLAGVRSWAPHDGDHIVFQGASGDVVLDFGPTGGPSLSAVANENDSYTLTPTDADRQAALAGALPAAPDPTPAADPADPGAKRPTKPAAAIKPVARPVTRAEVAGRYAVLRLGKDTGCMVTLDDTPAKSGLKASLAPACRDQGIVIFDPAAWQIVRNQLVLTAKRGHSTELSQQDDGTWANAPAKGRALTLKRL